MRSILVYVIVTIAVLGLVLSATSCWAETSASPSYQLQVTDHNTATMSNSKNQLIGTIKISATKAEVFSPTGQLIGTIKMSATKPEVFGTSVEPSQPAPVVCQPIFRLPGVPKETVKPAKPTPIITWEIQGEPVMDGIGQHYICLANKANRKDTFFVSGFDDFKAVKAYFGVSKLKGCSIKAKDGMELEDIFACINLCYSEEADRLLNLLVARILSGSANIALDRKYFHGLSNPLDPMFMARLAKRIALMSKHTIVIEPETSCPEDNLSQRITVTKTRSSIRLISHILITPASPTPQPLTQEEMSSPGGQIVSPNHDLLQIGEEKLMEQTNLK